MSIRWRAAIYALGVTFLAVGCTASHVGEPDLDGGTDADRPRPDSGHLPDAGVPIREDGGAASVRCGGRECAASQACCVETGSCYDLTRPGDCTLTMPPPPDSGSGTACASNADCEPSQFCRVPNGSCIGAGWCFGRDHSGISCDGAYLACGCDGRTYASLCDAYAAGTTVARAGMATACGSSGPSGAVVCGTDADCPADRTCCARTSLCTDPACVACCAVPPPGTDLGCGNDLDCRSLDDRGGSAYFCFGTGCGESGGGCVRPDSSACTGAFAPVCGCDGVTYSNACWAAAARTRTVHTGMCP